ncbi:MAG: hypothetical protein Ta2F_02470 [Termitinemataceae bacterium]|nr:MAG: hypothetical protein Ta2F_02470 [Termitinemataceae bacterium]
MKKYFLYTMWFLFFTFSVAAETQIVQVAGSGIIVKTIPSRSTVYVDGAKRGTTPLKMPQITSGVHTIKITKDFFTDYSVQVIVPQDGCLEISVDLEMDIRPLDVKPAETVKKIDLPEVVPK